MIEFQLFKPVLVQSNHIGAQYILEQNVKITTVFNYWIFQQITIKKDDCVPMNGTIGKVAAWWVYNYAL